MLNRECIFYLIAKNFFQMFYTAKAVLFFNKKNAIIYQNEEKIW